MSEQGQTGSDSEETSNSSSSEEPEGININGPNSNKHDHVSEYEKQRLQRIKDNSARMAALGLRDMASKLKCPVNRQMKRKCKEKAVDEEYMPCDGDAEQLSSESDGNDAEYDDEEFICRTGRRSRKVSKNKNTKAKKMVPLSKLLSTCDVIDEDTELMQAIALSLKESGVSNNVDYGPSNSCNVKRINNPIDGVANVEKDTRTRKRKPPGSNRVQMTEDEVIMHFFQLDEAGKGGINLRDLQRMANTHDFTWTDREMDDMITCFDNDGDGKINLDDFQGIVRRCNMIKVSANSLPVGK